MTFGLHALVSFFTTKATGDDGFDPLLDMFFAPLEIFGVLFGFLIGFGLAAPWNLGIRDAYIVNISVFLLGVLITIFVVQDLTLLGYLLLIVGPGLVCYFYWHNFGQYAASPKFK